MSWFARRYSAAARDHAVLFAVFLWIWAMVVTTIAACALGH